MKTQRVLIVGGGIAGMSAAIRLRALGWDVDLVEVDPHWRVYGTGISITAPTFRASRRLGIADELIAGGFGSRRGMCICTPDGRLITETPAVPIEPGLPTHGGILRPILHRILSAHTRRAQVDVRLGVTVRDLHTDAAGVEVETTDGLRREYALVIAADGTFSAMRSRLFPAVPPPQYTGQYCWRLLAEKPPQVDTVHFYVAGPVTAGLMPVCDQQMYLFLLHHEPHKVRIDGDAQWQRLRELMQPFSGLLGRIRDGLSANASIIARPLEAMLLQRPWSSGRVLLIGDAVHATTPHLASGAGLCMEDALVLGEELDRNTDVEPALRRFEERRWERCRLVVENSVKIGQLEQTQADPAALQQLMAESEAKLREDI